MTAPLTLNREGRESLPADLQADFDAIYSPEAWSFEAFLERRDALARWRVLQAIRDAGRERSPIRWMSPTPTRAPIPLFNTRDAR